jgi:hypothetical protein
MVETKASLAKFFGMPTTIFDALPGEKVLHSSTLAAVTPHCIVLTGATRAQTILPLSHLSHVKRVTVSYPILLVIAASALVLSGAAFASKEGGGAGPPFAIFGAMLLAGYFLSRRAAVSFWVNSEVFETNLGTLGEVKALLSAIESAKRMYN